MGAPRQPHSRAVRWDEAPAADRPGDAEPSRVLILDEPTTGLDPQARHLVWQKLRQLRKQGTTMVLTTHYMDEASQLCDRLVIMNDGKILAEGAPSAWSGSTCRRKCWRFGRVRVRAGHQGPARVFRRPGGREWATACMSTRTTRTPCARSWTGAAAARSLPSVQPGGCFPAPDRAGFAGVRPEEGLRRYHVSGQRIAVFSSGRFE